MSVARQAEDREEPRRLENSKIVKKTEADRLVRPHT